MIKYLFLIAFIYITNYLQAQVCNPPPILSEYRNHDMDGAFTGDMDDPIHINLYIHVIRNDNGTGGLSSTQVEDVKTRLDTYYNPLDIFFNYCV